MAFLSCEALKCCATPPTHRDPEVARLEFVISGLAMVAIRNTWVIFAIRCMDVIQTMSSYEYCTSTFKASCKPIHLFPALYGVFANLGDVH
jgi:hypothetical protein